MGILIAIDGVDGDKNEMYFDAYKKWKNMTVKEW